MLAEMCPAQCVTWTTCRLFFVLGKCGLLIIAKQEPGYEDSIILTTDAIWMLPTCVSKLTSHPEQYIEYAWHEYC